ncbi:S-layer homology domain-containing protein [Peptoniphilus phoceensis]|uniref:S-layer homology domain-containing protein n=1 Tax=Peptoniphilus phoceensis TaxID=1720298 RepID=UPI000784E1ED|nr:S-layer homology domain-containing protein [Peptoniphilus phoceensis]
MKRRFSLFLAILMLVSVFSPLGLGFEGNEIRFSTNVVEAAEGDAQLNEATPKEEVNDASNEVTPKEEVNNASDEVTTDVDNGTPSTEDKDVQPELDLKDQKIILTNDILTIGKDGTERNFTWYANTKEKGKFEFAKLNAEKDFKDATVLDATVIEKTNLSGYSSNQVTLDGLEPDTEYMYRFSNGDTVSEVKTFKTGGTGDFSFFAAGDPQIGSHGYLNGKDGWDKTLKLLPELDSSASFLLSLGDQVDTGKDEEQYDAYINREGFNGLTLAPIIGNHDERGNAHEEHFKVSNVQDEGKSNAGSNYYYVYNNTLFICLNSNNKDYAEHRVTIKKAVAESPNVKWRVVTFHHPPYTVARHALDDYITDMRSTLVPILKENKIDLVLNGHDHVYTRTHVMEGTKPIIEWENGEEGKAPSEYVNPKGIIYVTTNSASGSKFYDIMQDKNFEYSAVKNQEKVPNISNVKVTDNSIEVTTYRTSDKSVVDSFKIVKEDPTPVKPSEVRVTFKVDENKGKFLPNEDGVILNTRVLPMNFDATKLEKMAPEVEGLEGYKFKGWDKEFVGELDQDLTINAIFEKVEKTEPEEDNSVEPTKPTPTQPEKDDTREEPIRLFPRHHDRTETHPVYVSKSSIFTKEDALKKVKEIANKNLAKNSGKATDIDGHWAKDSINYALENNLIDLIGNEFKPNKNSTRYNVVKALGRFKKIDVEKYKGKSLKDVDANSEESAYVNWAIENGIIVGYEDNTFGGDREITREEIARILNLFAEKFDIKVKNLEAPKFKDQNKISDWASKDVKEATEKGLLVGRDDGTFGPKDNLTRAEVAQMIVNMIK